MKGIYWKVRNWMLGYGFYWKDGALHPKSGTCPYPLGRDHSAKACIERGDCGCDEILNQLSEDL